MDANWIIEGLISYLGLIVLLTFHEFGHAWVALKCGDDTARLQGRVSLNPLVHIDPIGTVLLPLMMIFLPFGVSRFMIGWAKPVPVNPHNLRNPRVDDILVTMAGPAMNLILAVVLVGLARVGVIGHWEQFIRVMRADGGVEFAAVLFQSHPDSAAGRLARAAKPDRHELGSLRQLRAVWLYRGDYRDANSRRCARR